MVTNIKVNVVFASAPTRYVCCTIVLYGRCTAEVHQFTQTLLQMCVLIGKCGVVFSCGICDVCVLLVGKQPRCGVVFSGGKCGAVYVVGQSQRHKRNRKRECGVREVWCRGSCEVSATLNRQWLRPTAKAPQGGGEHYK